MPDPTFQELQAQFLSAKADLAAIEALRALDSATLDPVHFNRKQRLYFKAKIAAIVASYAAQAAAQPEPEPTPRRRRFKSITQVPWPDKHGDLYYAFVAICEEDRAWCKYQGERWTEIESLPDI